jgi:3-deoxy-D-manno-octulosonic-acid transferase
MLYDIGFAIFSLIYLPTLIFKGKLHGQFRERFAVYPEATAKRLADAKDVIWIQAVSVGEVALCKSLVPAIRKEFPDRDIVFSTITKTGNDLARKLFADDAIILYFPLDFSFVARKAVSLIRPHVYIMVETEIWPNVLKELSLHAVPSILVNGRISDRSFGKYMLVRRFMAKTLARIRLFCMQSKADARKIMALGAPADRVRVIGTMKFDVDVAKDEAAIRRMKEALGLGNGDGLFVAGSTHPGEEDVVLAVYKKLLREFPGTKLLIAPRHVERSDEVAKVIRRSGFTPARISSLGGAQAIAVETPVYLLDTIGQLNDAYAAATIVFIGGSLVTHGGQNPIEPAIFEKPVLFGPHMFNFSAIAAALLDGNGALRIQDAEELFEKSRGLLREKDTALALGRNARKVVCDNRGATERTVAAIRELV